MAKTSDVIFTGKYKNQVSDVVDTRSFLETIIDALSEPKNIKPSTKPTGQFGRVVKIEVGGLSLTNELDIEFEVPFDDDVEANEAEIRIYNLSKKTIEQLKTDEEINITAGYATDTGIIFSGVISTVKTRWSGQDKCTTITAIDDVKQKERDIDSISFKKGVAASYILKTLVGKLNLPIAVFKVKKDHTYKRAVTVSGGLMHNIKNYAEVCGVSAYINKRKVYVQPITDGEGLNFKLTVDTGLIDSPEEFTEEIDNKDYKETIKGLKFKMLLEHRVTTASLIDLESRDFKGKYRVREGRHVCTESDFYTEVTAIE